jgi:hypothetical protein
MKTLRLSTLIIVSAMAASSVLAAGPRSKNNPRPAPSADTVSSPRSPEAGNTMIEKSGKRTSTVRCDGATAKCKAHCGK